jgi:hypothetical protein
MGTLSVSALKKKTARQWASGKGDLVVTAKGQPVAVLMRVASVSVESARSLVRSVRALQAQASLQQAAAANGSAALSVADIDAEIAAARHGRRH